MILAAGFGSRLHPLTLVRPKALVPFFGTPLMELTRGILKLNQINVSVVNTHHQGERLQDHLRLADGIRISEEREILGTGGGIAQASTLLPADEPLLIHNVDVVHNHSLQPLCDSLNSDVYASLLIQEEPRFMQVHLQGSRIIGFGPGGQAAYTGLMMLSAKARADLEADPSFSIIDFLEAAIARNRLVQAVNATGDIWFDAGYMNQYLALHQRWFHDSRFREFLLQILEQPPQLSGDSFVGKHTVIDPEARLQSSVIWDGVRLGPVSVKNCVVTDSMHVAEPINGGVRL